MRDHFCHYVSLSSGAIMQPIDRTLARSLSRKMTDKHVHSYSMGKAIVGKCIKVHPPMDIEIHVMTMGELMG